MIFFNKRYPRQDRLRRYPVPCVAVRGSGMIVRQDELDGAGKDGYREAPSLLGPHSISLHTIRMPCAMLMSRKVPSGRSCPEGSMVSVMRRRGQYELTMHT